MHRVGAEAPPRRLEEEPDGPLPPQALLAGADRGIADRHVGRDAHPEGLLQHPGRGLPLAALPRGADDGAVAHRLGGFHNGSATKGRLRNAV